ncbi:hypothetical protein BV898_07381 [Hypsibius exemplaris]|uniref:ZP domain-containing protein n=1 Tax=Hypsibius exemplaris TaxID=2072580 RepID=A0A1W0WTN5_HYPEX|nr:hypothetical protein BV898_07381 [Hypsibius exemplaris]
MLLSLVVVALLAGTTCPVSGETPSLLNNSTLPHNETDRSFSSFSITDIRPRMTGQVNGSDLQGPQVGASSPRVKRQQRLPTDSSDDASSSTTSSTSVESTSTDSNPTSLDDGQQEQQSTPSTRSPQPYPANRRANVQPLRPDPRLTGSAGSQQQGGQYNFPQDRSPQRTGQDSRSPNPSQRRPAGPRLPPSSARGNAYPVSDSRYPQQGQGRDQQSTDPRYRGRDSQRPQQSGQNIAVEIELLRFSNERALLANNRPCNSNGDECSYQITGSLETGDNRNRAISQQKSEIIKTPPKSDAVDILMRTRIVLCEQSAAGESAVLRLDVKTAEPTGQRRSRQIRLPTEEPTDLSTTQNADDITTDFTTAPLYNPHVEDAQNRVRQPAPPAEDQYSRDRYGNDDDASNNVPEQGRGGEEGQRYPPQPMDPARAGELVNSFECVINLSAAGYEQAHTAQWKTLSCRPSYPGGQMELMFRYNAYSIDASECGQSRPDLPLSWTPFAG